MYLEDEVTINYDTFLTNIKQIVSRAETVNDGWHLIMDSETNVSFIRKILLRKMVESGINENQNKDSIEFEDNLISKWEVGNASFDSFKNGLSIKWQYDVVYNESYQVPMICFNAWNKNGCLLTLPEVWKELKCAELNVNTYLMITQIDHPIYHIPVFALHPCKTDEVIKEIGKKTKNVVVTWLSAICPFLQLEFSHNIYYQCTADTDVT